ncbi:MAG: exodeoxyribonuclease VII large subunit [Methylophilaceae bacterium]|nr:exodeoxyribonuclease VII large subunit [Methylophilaceae bacterium]MDG1821643.1 exodeoxyribonuclease VII large subunit [Methylophilaceae bacterium]MDG2293314.1 exodeoxyribonuclease VII large subunit [Methylophilaceae bacterium]
MNENDSLSLQKSPQKILSVSELNRLAREVLQSSFPLFWVSGEISNLTRAASGHWYFSLKDASAQVRCVMFKGRNSAVDFIPREGDQIEARATVSLYEARGDFQLTIETIRQAGLGDLFEAFEQLKRQLQQQGLFDASRKQAIPAYAASIGIVTSPDAAALRDVISTLKRRNPGTPIIIYPTAVQGKSAAASIAEAIQLAHKRQEVDTLIICRGGGSIEDLWSFNEAIVAHAIANCTIPTISGVGHETDFTICDFVADVRAATPTAAAELACQDINQLVQKLNNLSQKLNRQIQLSMHQQSQKLDFLAQRLISPAQKLKQQMNQIQQLHKQLNSATQQIQYKHQQRYQQLKNSLEQLSPKAVLARGYAIISHQHQTITASHAVQLGQQLHIQLHSGELSVDVIKKN